jgi:hypothetical protein
MPKFTPEMLFFTAISLAGLFFLLMGYILNFVDEGFDLFEDNSISLDLGTTAVNSDFLNDLDLEDFSAGLPIPSFFSLKVLRIVMLCFGLGGNVGLKLGFSFYGSLITATITGFISGYIVYKTFTYIYSQTIYNHQDPVIIGKEARVTLSIPADGFGQIIVYIIGQRLVFRAKSADNSAINKGEKVKIITKEKATCSVQII